MMDLELLKPKKITIKHCKYRFRTCMVCKSLEEQKCLHQRQNFIQNNLQNHNHARVKNIQPNDGQSFMMLFSILSLKNVFFYEVNFFLDMSLNF